MQTNSITFFELITVAFLMGLIPYCLGLLFQIIVVVKVNKALVWKKLLLLLVVSRIAALTLAIVIWVCWFFSFDVMLGPILIPALIAELIISPVLLKIFGYHIIKRHSSAS
jgi:amino acid transporter